MPKKSVVDKIAVFEVLRASKEAVIKNGKVSTPSDDIWQNLCKQLGEKMTPKALYTFVKLNRHNVWAALDYSDEERLTDTDSSDNDNDFEQSSSPFQNKDCKTFNVELPFEQWIHMIPHKVTYKKNTFKKREYTILKPGTWTHVVNQGIWKEVTSTCTITFKRAKVYPRTVSCFIKSEAFAKSVVASCTLHVKRNLKITAQWC